MFILPESDTEAIQHIHHHWIDLEKQGRGLEVLQYCTDTVRWLIPDSEMLIGKEAAYPLLHNPETQIIDIATKNIEILGQGRVAYKTSQYTTQFTLENNPVIQTASGTHLWILHKQDGDQWKVALVTWQSCQ